MTIVFARHKVPFTISHAGFVVPLRGCLSEHTLLGLMLGAVAPDCGYFVRAFALASFAHTAAGALLVCVPIGFALYGALRACFRQVAEAMPAPHAGYLASWDLYSGARRPSLWVTAIAILAGALSHNFADSFTHFTGVGVALFPQLKAEVMIGGGVSAYRLLQYSGSVLGMALIVAAYCRGLQRYCAVEGCRVWQDWRRWAGICAMAGVTFMAAVLVNAALLPVGGSWETSRAFFFYSIITWMPMFTALALGIVALRRVRR